MNTVKVTSSGQITLPKIYRNQYNTSVYKYEIVDGEFRVRPFLENNNICDMRGSKYSLSDLKQIKFKSKSRADKYKNLSVKIDEILYRK
jgi:bifunctional DNA-binding transcriptional regulator/antitoxin component of YhaV-PrlF toxin-antitoxin module